jgi:uncharacterized protein
VVARYLLDINVLIALAWPAHVDHQHAHAWFRRSRGEGFATCPLSQLGFVRISSNPKFTKLPASPRDALALLDRITALREHVFWPDTLSCNEAMEGPELIAGHQQLTDRYLVGLARSHGGVLATFDRGIPTSGRFRDVVEQIGARR